MAEESASHPIWSPPDAARLRKVLEIEDPKEFEDEFFALGSPFAVLPVDQWPPLFRAVRGIALLGIDVEVHGIQRFFEEWPFEIGAYALDVAELLRQLGVPEGADAIMDAIALYPGRTLPPRYSERFVATSAVYKEHREALKSITARYKDVMPRIRAPLQRYLRKHEAELLDELGALRASFVRSRSMESLDEELALITDSDLLRKGLPREYAAFWAIEKRVHNRIKPSLREKGLTAGERLVYLVSLMDGEVNNGGLHQFVSNSSGDFVEEIREHLRTIGATSLGAVLDHMCALFPEGSVPADRGTRNRILDDLAERNAGAAHDAFEALTHAYYENNAELYSRVLEWVRQHKTEFVDPPERSGTAK